MHNYTIFGQVLSEEDDGTFLPRAVYMPSGTFEAADPEQAIKLFYIEGPGQEWTADQEARLLGQYGLEYFAVPVLDVEEDILYYGHVHIEWDNDEYVRHIEIEPTFTPGDERVTQSGAEAVGPR